MAGRNVDPVKALEYALAQLSNHHRDSLLKDVALTELEESLEAANQRIEQLEKYIREQEAAKTGQELPAEHVPVEN